MRNCESGPLYNCFDATPLHLAVAQSVSDVRSVIDREAAAVVKLLVEAGADPEARTKVVRSMDVGPGSAKPGDSALGLALEWFLDVLRTLKRSLDGLKKCGAAAGYTDAGVVQPDSDQPDLESAEPKISSGQATAMEPADSQSESLPDIEDHLKQAETGAVHVEAAVAILAAVLEAKSLGFAGARLVKRRRLAEATPSM
jgi:hypothetical protein